MAQDIARKVFKLYLTVIFKIDIEEINNHAILAEKRAYEKFCRPIVRRQRAVPCLCSLC